MPRRHLKFFRIFIPVLLFFLISLQSFAADIPESGLEIEDFSLFADRIEITGDASSISASGNVRIESDELSISAEHFEYLKKSGEFRLWDDVRLHLPQIEIEASELSYNSISAMLEAQNAQLRLKENNKTECTADNCCRNRAVFTAGNLKRDSDGKWSIENGSFTSCDCGEGQPPSWRIEARSIKAQENESAVAEKPKFYIRDTPVFALPAALFPISQRRSGFLAPRVSYTDANGFRLGDDYFQAFERSADATFGLDIMHKRGFMASAETRYNYGNVSGEFDAFYLPDWSAEPSANNFNRFSLGGSHVWDSRGATVQKIKLELLSDTQVPQHFGRDWRERSVDYAESAQMWEFSLDEMTLGFSNSFHQALSSNLRNDGWLWDLNGNSPAYTLSRLSLNVPAMLLSDGHVMLSLRNSADVVQSIGQADTAADDDSLPPLSAVSALFDFEPEIAFPFQILDAIEAAPYMSYRQKLFVTDDFSGEKSYAALGLDLQSRIWRVFGLNNGALKHEIIPGIGWRWLPYSHDGTKKTWDSRQLRLLEYPDASASPQHVEARLTNRLALRRGDYLNGVIYRFFEFSLIQRVFVEATANDPQERRIDDGRAELILRAPKAEWKNRLGLRWNDGHLQSARSSLALGPFWGITLGAEYLLIENGPLLGDWIYQRYFEDEERFHQTGGNIAWTFAKSFTLGYAVDVSIEEAQLIEQRWLAAYRSKCNCWGLELTASHRPGLNFPDVFLNIDLDFM